MTVTIIGISETAVERGTISNNTPTGATITVGPPGTTNSIWSRPYLQMVGSGGGFVSLSVANLVTDKGVMPGPVTPGIFAKNVQKFDVRFDTIDEIARAVVTTVFFG